MEQDPDGGPVVKCEDCLFCSKHQYGWRFCLALAELLDDKDKMPCDQKYFKEPEKGVDRYEQIVDAFRTLDE